METVVAGVPSVVSDCDVVSFSASSSHLCETLLLLASYCCFIHYVVGETDIAGVLAVAGVHSAAGIHAVSGVLAIASVLAHKGVAVVGVPAFVGVPAVAYILVILNNTIMCFH